ncbi:MAG: cysteine methyltransferase [Bdellovibrio sp. CG12_big_fil_rev_8_21_14_0_65_39_13]|nr:MAG: cysteine methyltransferase [Bdellovibrio sp. CG22_combo_CG10-13_8_21_14_all_39_27]PIQ59047.1 MAG: cysteine methyltransferase [Bdellovibrio sp. CG12_big_fil_rev_8_21_14_0_65_39_13]PIR33110.1 MAG: cysteine methyltransferase [Bdellovibrio sp. CG11_big_fil_rev_8_21_14_0_20_39_38]PJB53330.1 MAG: cysteine methyltransferase [Bdellovibrio sp. CG_4_9_14_3_um_filter_39_7]
MKFKTNFGFIYICATSEFVTKVSWQKVSVKMASDKREKKLIEMASTQIYEYLDGRRKQFDLPLSYQGTSFQEEVWSNLLKIPYGQTQSYTELAVQIERPLAVRAVGTANGQNPLCLIIPCHRVIAKSGQLSGYIGGEKIKEKLLELEKMMMSGFRK